MEKMNQEGGEQGSEKQGGTAPQERRRDRRMDMASLFGGYEGPERRSGRDRRSSQ